MIILILCVDERSSSLLNLQSFVLINLKLIGVVHLLMMEKSPNGHYAPQLIQILNLRHIKHHLKQIT